MKVSNEVRRVNIARVSLFAALSSVVLAGGLVGCSDGDNELRSSRTAQNEVDGRFQSDEARASQRNLDAAQYESDNTGRNMRDNAARASRTADNQAMSGDENQILADIRREITANDEMSTYAKNVKIVVENNTVTLRGPVNSQNEKQWIERTTTANARNLRVINQLEVREES